VIFALIAASSIFVTGSNDFWPAAVCAAFGAFVFAYGYIFALRLDATESGQSPHGFKWWIEKRPQSAATPGTSATTTGTSMGLPGTGATGTSAGPPGTSVPGTAATSETGVARAG
jgi:hypothetical protein